MALKFVINLIKLINIYQIKINQTYFEKKCLTKF
jgi:hypothetical protein